jgi:hypothetical protein
MRLFGRFAGQRGRRRVRGEQAAYLARWSAARHGVEVYVEPQTLVTETTVVLIAHDGEWTRRRVAGPRAAHDLGRQLGLPVYDVTKLGYPQRMRDHARRRSIELRRAQAARDQPGDPGHRR